MLIRLTFFGLVVALVVEDRNLTARSKYRPVKTLASLY